MCRCAYLFPFFNFPVLTHTPENVERFLPHRTVLKSLSPVHGKMQKRIESNTQSFTAHV